eukprot:CAMPEP_0198513918 /NCGR_PEP_ID=MMETSP1462-20131121/16367_1 /TAXON_ID=1333877 /ORGANISM="Brandtodinium nutriculum, Strain RCC3387" /LENGTH=58 /DNA_ID=CAMNT_0044243353 /DNA_START=1 /DNA_END=174 /DNA_ORIENTATION=-
MWPPAEPDDQLHRGGAELDDALAELRRQVACLAGRMDATIEQTKALADPEEALAELRE